jgi:redox-sensitive bicupin YhaK (pirin superfamily)
MSTRTIAKSYAGTPATDGAGVKLNRIIGYNDVQDIDPFLMLDFFDSRDPQDYVRGFPWHPHRGIETITYLVDGLIEHGDSLGNKGVIGPAGCQWMTAGSGIIHQEMPRPSSHMLGAQLWLNLPAAHKMTEPAYRDITEQDLAIYADEQLLVKVIAGSFKGKKGPVSGTYVDPLYLDATVRPGGSFEPVVPEDETVLLLLLEGEVQFPDGKAAAAPETRLALLTHAAKTVIRAEKGARFVLIAGRPLHEPVAWGGPIVMNTREELSLAFRELDAGTFIKHK